MKKWSVVVKLGRKKSKERKKFWAIDWALAITSCVEELGPTGIRPCNIFLELPPLLPFKRSEGREEMYGHEEIASVDHDPCTRSYFFFYFCFLVLLIGFVVCHSLYSMQLVRS